jgi:FkbM family methyltransferase
MTTNLYSTALKVLIKIKRRLNIVVVGANDGRINDPIYEFAMGMSHKTNMLLIEPNKFLLPYLRESYSSHPSHQITNCAIGQEGELTLYAVKEAWFGRFQPAYAKGWPLYRAATGITSANRDHVERALLREGVNPDDAIETLNVPCQALSPLLSELNWPPSIDVLQIDAEGHDDSVIYASSPQRTRPKLIYFENHNIPQARMDSLVNYLASLDYRTYRMGGDSLSVDSRINPTCTALNGIIVIILAARRLANAIKGQQLERQNG